MKNFLKRIYCLFYPSKKDMRLINGELKNLHTQLFNILNDSNKVESLVKFFQVILPFQESGLISETIRNLKSKNYGQNNMAIKTLEKIENHLVKVQNSEYNQAEFGEIPNYKTIFLGGIFSISKESVEYFLKKREKLEKQDLGIDLPCYKGKGFTSVWYCLNNYQAENFLKNHTEKILLQISILKELKSF